LNILLLLVVVEVVRMLAEAAEAEVYGLVSLVLYLAVVL
jgi:hypothetical protein